VLYCIASPTMDKQLVIYGAAGYTGRLVARAARARGLAPLLCGRSAEKLRPLADELGLPFQAAPLDDARGLDRVFTTAGAVINAAGPFSSTVTPVLEACLRSGVDYLDLSGEVASLEAVSRRDHQARGRGVLLMPGVGFDVVPSDCLAAHVWRRLKRAVRLSLGISGLTLLSRGSARTMIEQIAEPTWVRRGGALTRIPPGSLERGFDYGNGSTGSLATSWGDVVSAHFTTGIPDVTVYFDATVPVRLHTNMVRWFGWAVPFTPWQAWLNLTTDLLPEGPTDSQRASCKAVIVAEAEDDRGNVARARLRTPEAYTMTAHTAVEVASRVLAGDREPGFQTPGRLYGPDFVLSFPDVVREDL
jgi:short subunit dehydrogenase-like uncharacterized protein